MTTYEIKNALEAIVDRDNESIEYYIALCALNHDEDCTQFFSDFQNAHIYAGLITSFLFSSDPGEFFDTYYEQIEQIRRSHKVETLKLLESDGDLKTKLAWFALCTTVEAMTKEFGLEV